ncbi:virulence factor TspB C-terminal domain-related protein [Delftia acidovorans]|uniref:virulence factor TspB C-terminal domain-related protein n=1 Tax=Delftia acidovorans TaxID=80866 RepID=UPI0033424680
MCSDRKGWLSEFRGSGSGEFFCHSPDNYTSGGPVEAFPGCSRGCMLSAGTTVTVKDDAGKTWTTGSGRYVGSTCSPDVINKLNEGTPEEKEVTPPGAKDPGKCNGQPGTVNGVTVCLPYTQGTGDEKTNVETRPDGSKTETTSKTTCTGSTCSTETKVTTKDPSGNTTGTTTTVTQTPKDDYCARNPGSGVCKALDPSKQPGTGTGGGTGGGDDDDDDGDKGSFGGSCSGGWTCEGDAIQCAIAKEQHKRSCELFEDRDNEAYKLYDKERDKEGSVLGSLKGNKDIDVSQYVNDRDDFIGSGSCPADKVIQFSYGEVTVPYSRLCPYLEMLGTILIICAGIAGARIITRRDS